MAIGRIVMCNTSLERAFESDSGKWSFQSESEIGIFAFAIGKFNF